MKEKEVIYFVSDFHLGIDGKVSSKEREQKLLRFFDFISSDATMIYLVGDVFDYWFEYKRVIPKGYSRFLGKIGSLIDKGISIEFFTGNHDMWMFHYFQDEFGIPIHRNPIQRIHDGKVFYIGHGDGLGPGDKGYKFIKKVFGNRLCQKLFGTIHPNIGLKIMKAFSRKSRNMETSVNHFLGPENEWLIQFSEALIENQRIDYFVFGHRHLPIDYTLSNGTSKYINLGDWLQHESYGRYTNGKLEMLFFENADGKVFP